MNHVSIEDLRILTPEQLVLAFAAIAKEIGFPDVLVALCGPQLTDGTFVRAVNMDANWGKLAGAIGEVIRLHVPEEGKQLLVRKMYGMDPDPKTNGAALEPGERVN